MAYTLALVEGTADHYQSFGKALWAEERDTSATLKELVKLADALCGDSHTIGGDLVAELQELFSEAELAELILVAGQANLNNRAGNAAKQLLSQPSET